MRVNLRHRYALQDKYVIVGGILRNAEGTLLDIGARDECLRASIDLSRISYHSADLDAGHDYQIDLERKLEFPDAVFDYVVALDVLEHVENIHQAFRELARVTRKCLIIALPNMATLSKRLRFLLHGSLGTSKYDLHPECQRDRHRWVTVLPQINQFFEINASRTGFEIEQVVQELGAGRGGLISGTIAHARLWLVSTGILPASLIVRRCVFILTRTGSHC